MATPHDPSAPERTKGGFLLGLHSCRPRDSTKMVFAVPYKYINKQASYFTSLDRNALHRVPTEVANKPCTLRVGFKAQGSCDLVGYTGVAGVAGVARLQRGDFIGSLVNLDGLRRVGGFVYELQLTGC
eukprot:1608798-Pyramimonas_sp.AAC.3